MGFGASSRPRAWAVSPREQAADSAVTATSAEAYLYLCVTNGPRKIDDGNLKSIRRPSEPYDSVSDCHSTASQPRTAQPQRIGDDGKRTQRHRGACPDGRNEQARERIQHS